MKDILSGNFETHEIEETSELLKEQIYSTITLLGILAAFSQTHDHLSHQSALISVVGAAVTLWLAISIASRMSYQVVHGKRMSFKVLRSELFGIRRALIAPAIPPAIFIGLSWAGLFSIESALFISIITLLLSFVLFAFLAGRRIHTTWYEIAIASFFEVLIGVGVVLLKIAVGH